MHDFDDFDRAWAPIHEALDHRLMNDVPGLENPTSEMVGLWLWARLCSQLPGLHQIDVSECEGVNAIINREDFGPK